MQLALARRYRPALFRDVVGQDLFIRLLRNALSQGRVGHGLLLTGIRGVGKTTIARLVAKALCCTHRDAEEEPCNACPSCLALMGDTHVDILEIDAASHTGVEDMRQILESCPYGPLLGPYRIYILDEVHMLSKSAFNALLKTLEEPPAHVKFIFATTEIAKVPATILSRCQQLHLHRIPSSVLVPYLAKIVEKEGFSMEEEALALLAQSAEGGVRDALSLLEQVLLLSSVREKISLQKVLDILGLPRREILESMLRALERAEVGTVLPLLRDLYHRGTDPLAILTQLMHLIHEKTMEPWSKGLSGKKADAPTVARMPMDRWDQWWQLGQKGLGELATSPFPLLALEMLVLRMAYMTKFPTPSQILSLVEPLQKSQERRNSPSAGHGGGTSWEGQGKPEKDPTWGNEGKSADKPSGDLQGKESPSPTKTPDLQGKESPSPTKTPDLQGKESPSPTKTPDLQGKDSPSPTKTPDLQGKDSPSPTKTPDLQGKDSPSPTKTPDLPRMTSGESTRARAGLSTPLPDSPSSAEGKAEGGARMAPEDTSSFLSPALSSSLAWCAHPSPEEAAIHPSNPSAEGSKSTKSPLRSHTMESMEALLAALEREREGLLHAHLRQNVSWIRREGNRLILHWDVSRGRMPSTFTPALEKFIQGHGDSPCGITWQERAEGLSPRAQEDYERDRLHALAQAHPEVQSLLKAFPGTVIEEVALL